MEGSSHRPGSWLGTNTCNIIHLQVQQDLANDIMKNVQMLMDNIRFSPAPEAIAYLRLLGSEIGYMKTSEMRKMAETLFMYYHVFFRVLPAKVRSNVS